VEFRRERWNQTACGNGADLRPKDVGSKACTVTYLTRWLPSEEGLARKAYGKPMVNLCLKRREIEAAKKGDDTQLDQKQG